MSGSRALRVYPQTTPLRGRVTVPGDKSISHRAVMLGALAEGRSVVRRWLPAGDTLATLAIARALGIAIDVEQRSPTAWDLTIDGAGLHGLQPPTGSLDARNAGTAMRLLAGILAGQRFPSVIDGSPQLRRRPMRRITQPLQQMGAAITSEDGYAPLTITPAPLHGIDYTLPVASAQVKSAVLLAGLYAAGPTTVREPGPARDHTERMLTAMGVTLASDDGTITLTPGMPLKPLDMDVPADISSAAFPLVAAAVMPHASITLEAIGLNPTRTGILDLLRRTGATFAIAAERVSGGEPVADITASFSELHAAEIDGPVVVRAIDEFPIFTVAATQAAGTTVVRDAAELRVKEVDRISVLAGELRRMGVVLTEHPDGYTVNGPQRLHGAVVDSHDDHRLGMTLAVAALLADGPTTIARASCIADSFPGFVETLRAIGARLEWVD